MKWFKKKISNEVLLAPISGKVVSIQEVPDPTFSQKMMGDGVAIIPNNGEVVSPLDGKIIGVFPTKHAVGIRGKSGIEVLIHIGLETVSLNGEGFVSHVKEGDTVVTGDSLITFDLDLISEKAVSAITPVIITNMDIVESLEKKENINSIFRETAIMTVEIQ